MEAILDLAWADFELLKSGGTDEPIASEFLCPSCNHPKTFEGPDIDLPTCTNCGRVDDSFICEEAEWRSGADDGGPDPSRVGAPVNTDLFSESWGRTTYMTVKKTGSWDDKRLARINHHSSMNHRDRALFHAYEQMDRIGKSTLGLPEIVMYSAKMKYREFNAAVLTRGAIRNGIKANCIFQACRENGVARTTQEIATAFGIPTRDLSRTFDMYQEKIPEKVVHITSAGDLIGRFFNSITGIPDSDRGRLKMKVARECKILEEHVELMGRTPKAIACAVMVRLFKDISGAPSRSDLCKICEISVPTLGKIEAIIAQLKDTGV